MNVVVGEIQFLQPLEFLEFAKIRMTHDVVEANVLKAYLFHSLLEVTVVQDLKSIAINEKHRVSLNFSMA